MYAELLCRSNGSFLRGGSKPEELVEQAAELGYKALAIADLNGVYGLAKAYWKAKDHPDLKLIFGAELTLQDTKGRKTGLVLHAQSKEGWSLLCRLITASHAAVEKREPWISWETMAEMVSGSSGRMKLAALPRDAASMDLGLLKDLFGRNLYLPVIRVLDGKDEGREVETRRLSAVFDLRPLACNDVHYHIPGRQALQDILTCIREGVTLEKAGHLLFPNAERHLKSPEDMIKLFRDWPEAVRNGLDAAASCDFSLKDLRYYYPSEWIPQGHTAQSWLEKLAWDGVKSKYPAEKLPQARKQLRHEMDMVGRMAYADYFLTIHDIVAESRRRGILCQGRGSAANSILCYCLGITSIDPLHFGLLFERFLSEERREPPDIDVDFEHDSREKIIQYLYDRYGRDRAAMVAAVIKYRDRSAVGEISKALGRPTRVQRTLRDTDMGKFEPLVQELTEEIWDFPRHLSIHSGGFVLSGPPLIDLVPVEPARMKDRTVVQWDKYDLDYVGLMKVDVLGLGMLTALKKCMDLTGFEDLAKIPDDDPDTYLMIQKADTVGVFQIESRAQMNMLGRLRPEDFYDLVIEVAIVRPGPIVGKMVHPYLRRRKKQDPVTYEHPALKTILKKTLGVPLFQEQIMRIAVELAGFTPGEADELRRAIGAWRSDGRLEGIGGRLMDNLLEKGLSPAFCEQLSKEIQGFAHYGFPESHAASFARLCYASSYLKCHHPAAFACALINSQPMGFYANHTLVDDAKRHGVEVLPVHPNFSGWDCHLEGPNALRLGFRVMEGRGMGEDKVKKLMAEREKRSFEGLDDFAARSGLGPALLRKLALGNAFEDFHISQRDALWRILLMEAFAGNPQNQQMDFFTDLRPDQDLSAGFQPLNLYQVVDEQYKAFGLSTLAHPMEGVRLLFPKLPKNRAENAREARSGCRWSLAGLVIVRQRPETAQGTVFATLEDETGLLDLVIRREAYQACQETLLNHSFLIAQGILQRDRDSVSLLLEKLEGVELAFRSETHNWH
jgi:error-prone DNA polymerase